MDSTWLTNASVQHNFNSNFNENNGVVQTESCECLKHYEGKKLHKNKHNTYELYICYVKLLADAVCCIKIPWFQYCITTYTNITIAHSADYSIQPEAALHTLPMHLENFCSSFEAWVTQLEIWALKKDWKNKLNINLIVLPTLPNMLSATLIMNLEILNQLIMFEILYCILILASPPQQ